jgi:hypothetical protein
MLFKPKIVNYDIDITPNTVKGNKKFETNCYGKEVTYKMVLCRINHGSLELLFLNHCCTELKHTQISHIT